MKNYVVIRDFIDKFTKKLYKMGDLYDTNKERAAELQNGGFIEKEMNDSPDKILDQNANNVIDITKELSENELKELFENESSGKNRTTVLKHIESLLGSNNEPS
ncbi:hypothetical protein [Chengkuizengella marina]|uniref:Uncharacterized protein n=1 Tax=Chengkuizengella marina TaxID=2507566 RepID=A0A6N9Q781_9BACL|nr:hypothetical protein [Chengkuizengella marina]NBI30718.1 hypothetical protein [Chengkuizengella marina]